MLTDKVVKSLSPKGHVKAGLDTCRCSKVVVQGSNPMMCKLLTPSVVALEHCQVFIVVVQANLQEELLP